MPTAAPAKRTRRTYSLEDIEAGLLALAVANGSAREANRLLTAQKRDVPVATLTGWKDQYAERYNDIRAGKATELQVKLEADISDAMAAAHAAVLDAIDLEHRRIKASKVKDASASAQRLATSFGILADKQRLMRNEPTVIVQNQNGDDVIKKLEGFKDLFIEGTATEVPNELPEAT